MKDLQFINEVSDYHFSEVNGCIVCNVRTMNGEWLRFYGSNRSEAYEKAQRHFS